MRLHGLTGDRDAALGTILTAERIAPEHVHQHYLGRDVVVTLLRATIGQPTIQLDKLARRMKVSESI